MDPRLSKERAKVLLFFDMSKFFVLFFEKIVQIRKKCAFYLALSEKKCNFVPLIAT